MQKGPDKSKNNYHYREVDTFSALPNSGATKTVMGRQVAEQLQLVIRPDTEGHRLVNASEAPMNVIGVTSFFAKVEGSGPEAKKIEALVTSDAGMSNEMLIGHEELKSLKVISKVFPIGYHDEEERVKRLEPQPKDSLRERRKLTQSELTEQEQV